MKIRALNVIRVVALTSAMILSFEGLAQTYNMSNATISTCSGTFFDSGGNGGSYGSNELFTMTFCSDQPGDELMFDFTFFDLEACCDDLTIYDGPNTASPQVPGSPFAGTSPGTVVSTSGCLTFVFDSDFSIQDPGWVATISCFTPAAPTCSDGIQNQGETGIDCGGPCPACTNFTIDMGGTVSTCTGTFYDSGGAGGSYGSNELTQMTFCSDQPGDEIQFDFTFFDLEACCDNLTIYDGPNTASPQVPGSPFAGTSPGTVVSTSGCLTFVFDSDFSVQDPGWVANISCFTPAPPTCTDGIQNQGEAGIDCGGPCPACTDINIDFGGTITTCTGNFYDSGGAGGNYGSGETSVITICPDSPGSFTQLDFSQFATEDGFDQLCVYDGPNTGSPLMGCFDNGLPLTGIIQATNPGGCLTFEFTSDGSVTFSGWVATISCTIPCQTILTTPTYSEPIVGGYIYMCQGEQLDLFGAQTYPQNGTGYTQSDGTSTFEWDVSGTTLNGQNSSITFPNEGIYTIDYTVTDIEGCQNADQQQQIVLVSTTPIFDGMGASADPICLGDQSTLTGGATPVTYVQDCTPPIAGTTFLPDGSGVSYTTSVTVDCFTAGQTVTSVNDIQDICLDLEHSYAGDLEFVLICPNGQQILLGDQNGGGAIYGQPVASGLPVDDNTANTTPGIPETYCWSPTSTNGLMGLTTQVIPTYTDPIGQVSNNVNQVVPGTYEAEGNWADLIGCPLNGDWTIEVTDQLTADNGYIFSWSMNFDPGITPVVTSFTPTIVSDGWQADPTIVSGTNPIVVEPTAVGPACYVYEVTDDFGCTYDTTFCITVIPSPVLDPVADVVACDDYTLPPISGTDLSGNEAYFSGPNGTGTQFNPGQVITVDMTPIYVHDPGAGNCDDEVSFNITIDNTDPVINCPGNLTAVCSIAEQPPYLTFAQFTAAGGSASDDYNLDVNSFTLLSEVSDGLSCPETVTRTYQIADSCGHTATCVQTITIDDNVNPTGTAPANITVQCIGDVPAANPALITDEADNCAIQSVTHLGDASDGLSCPETITRTYRITDVCGNFIDVNQTITVDDTQAPVFAAPPANVTVECIGDVPAMTNLNWTDNCDGAGNVPGIDGALVGGPCGGTITRTWTYTDACGNVATETQTITVDDTQAPVFAAPPANVTVECLADVPAMTNLNWTDNCDGAGNVPGVDGALVGGACGGTITRTWTYTDACGNVATETQTITVDDTTPPTGTAPANVTVQCMGDVPAVDINAITDEADNCTAAPVVAHVSDTPSGGTCPITIDRVYSITDDCGNQITVTQVITVDDTTPPTGTAPANVTVQCMGDVPAVDINAITDEADNCTAAPVVAHVSDTPSGGTCPVTIDRVYSITDECGNVTTVTQVITVDDSTPPTGTAPANVTVQCMGDVPAVDINAITDEADNCTAAPIVAHVSDTPSGGTCPVTIDRVYSITDDCGNQITVTQVITVDDTTPPTGTAPGPITVECIGDVPAADPLLITDEADNCTAAPTVNFVSDVSDGLSCPETITRTYEIVDDCGNTTTVTQTITVDDTTPPTGTAPGPITVECIGDVPAGDPLLITDEADNCTAAPTVNFVGDVSDGLSCPETITRTYEIVDDCGNTTTVTQTITVDDTTPPTATSPAPINLPGGPVPAPDPLLITDEADNCGVPVVAFVSEVSDGGNCPETVTQTYSVTDACGNQITVDQVYIIGDPNPPTASNPAPIAVECITDVPAPDPLVVTDEADNGGPPVVAFVNDFSDGNTCPETITRTYSVTDACGNFIFVTQTITVHDLTPPTGTAPGPIAVECIGDVPAADPLLITDEADNCGTPTVAFVGDVSDGLSCPETITRTYSITDSCGNSITVDQIITVDDVTPPTGTAPANVTVQCMGDVPAVDVLAITDEADNCTAAPVVAHVSDTPSGGACPITIDRVYSITDACGNVTTVTQVITVDDTTPPTASNPAQTIVPGGPAPAPDPLVVIDEADNCTANPTVAFVSQVSDGNPCPETITYTYSVTDDCGNTINVTHEVLITDPVAPTGTAPADITVDCITAVPAADPLLITDEADNNGVPTVTHLSDVSDGNTCPEIITRTYRITDPCGNFIDVVQLITVHDLTPPTGTAPGPITVECIGDVPAADPLLITDEADNCGTPTVAFVGDVSDGLSCPETITRTYSITDSCGNSITVDQIITVDDVTPPTATAPANVTVQCMGDVPAVDVLAITDEADNCTAAPVVAHVSDTPSGGACPITIDRVYSITDDCGNVTTVTQVITVDDTTPPTASNPAQTIVPGGPAPAPDPLVVIDEADNCTANPTVAFVSQVSDGNPCPETITYTYSVTDDCGNTINVTHEVLITDPVAPTGTAPADITVDCITAVPAADPLLITDEADNNGVPTVTHLSDVSDGNTCPEIITRTYRITDPCGNFIDVVQLITVHDLTPPTGTAPGPIAVECIGDVPAADPALIVDEADNCGTPTVAFVGDVSDGLSCPETITRTYSITDSCGNSITVDQIITVDDVTPPTGTAPGAVAVECIGDVPVADPALVTGVSDNCTAVPTVNFVSDVSDGLTCPETITRTYEIVDDCGNTTTVTQTITVDDITPPTASNPAQTIVPGGPAPAPDPLVVIDEADNCGVPTVAFVSQVSDGNPCPETITYTYSVTDDCGNTINVTHEVLITDPVAPTGTAPADITVDCITAVPAADPLLITDESDNNGVPTVTHLSDVSDGNTCPEIITRTYRITDPCGNFIDVVQLITVHDLTPPTGTAPANIAVECIGDVPAADPLLITDEADNCGTPTVAFVGDVSDGLSCPETITRTYSITDSCGNSITVDQIITVDDITPPTGTAPGPVVVECIGDVPPANIADVTGVTDNCPIAPVVAFVSDVSDGNTCPETITRTYSITDACGNVTNVTQTITVDDITPPTASNPAQTVVPGGPAPAPDPLVVIDEADNCTAAPVVAFVSQVSDGNPCPETITYTYSVTDDCGNSINVTHEVLITDPISPTGTAPADITVDCITAVPAADPLLITDEADNNGVPTVTHLSDVSDGNTCPEIITRTYRITDPCGNFIDVVQLITVHDLTPPTATAPANVAVECIGDVPPANILDITDEADNCGTPTVAHVGDVSDGLSCPETITRTYSITDSCGNSITVDQIITVDDITPPTGTAPANITVECIGDVPAADPLLITDEADNCPIAPVVAFVSDVSDGNTCPETITRTYSITDACGNVTNVTQTITVDDTTPPTASNPAQTIVPGGPAPAPDPLVVIDEADNCTAAPVVAFVSQVSDGNPCPETITYTYSVTDDCGNSINVTHEVLITDPINPTGTAPADITVECIGDVPAADPLLITDEADNNGVPAVAFVSDVSDGLSCPETITRTYSITDICGNQILVTQLITVNDITPPTGTAPANVAVECIGDVPAPDPLLITDEADNCPIAPVVAFVSDVSDGLSCPETITRTYSITDACGNVTNVTQTITVDDITPPTGTAPANITVECIGDVPAADPLLITDEADNCPIAPVVAFVSDVSDGNTCPETITRTYSITDACGNVTNVTQTITVDDITPPTASNLPPQTVVLVTDIPAPDILDVFDEADNCTVNPVVAFVSDVSDGNNCPETITRTYSVTDDCGNQILVTQIWTVADNIAPTASNPLPVNVECIGQVPAPDILVVTDEADNSGLAPVVAYVGDVSDGQTCPETITRTYSVTDQCGNQITVDQTITVNDITPPTATAPANVTVECIGDVPPANILDITDEADNCTAAPIVAHVGDVSDGLSCPETITRTYSITDDCGNQITVDQIITVNDITPPTGVAPANVNVECIADVPVANIADVTGVTDNCTVNPVVVHVGDVSDGLTCPETITRTYSITDDCGNQITVDQIITVNDITPPTGVAPAPVVVECIFDVPAVNTADVTGVSDNCTANPVVAHVSDVSDGLTCPETITRTYSVTDDCGNQINLTQSIIVNDITNPTASNPAPITVYCASDVPQPDPAVVIDEADNCTAAPVVAHVSDVSDGNVCAGEIITRTYSVTDDCGNQITVTQLITIDVVTPTVNAGTDVEVCEGVPVTLTASNYPMTATISWDNGVIDGVAFQPPVGTTTYTVTADECSGQCVVTDQVDVTIHPTPVISFSGDDLIGCDPHTVNFTNTSTEQYDCVWDFGNGQTANDCGDQTVTYLTPGLYDVTLTVTSDQGCIATDTYADYIEVVPQPVADFTFSPTDLDILMTEVEFDNQSMHSTNYIWNFGDLSPNSFEENPTHIYPDETGGTYTVTLFASNDIGCSDTAERVITIKDVLIFYVPNIFTPDGNSYNENFMPVFSGGLDIYDYHLTIFNRWGEVIFESYNVAVGWDGHYGDGGLVQDGVYVWQLEFGETMSDKKHKHRGHVTVLK